LEENKIGDSEPDGNKVTVTFEDNRLTDTQPKGEKSNEN